MRVGNLVLEAAHTIGIVHDLAVLIYLGNRGESIASYAIFETLSTVVVLLEIIEIIGPVLDFDI